jgi:hypothetical protein
MVVATSKTLPTTNVILSAVGHIVLAWLRILLRLILNALDRLFAIPTGFLTADFLFHTSF